MVKLNILIVGVGGQGVVLASDILGGVALEGGLDVKKTDTLGMAQRGGSVVSHIRIGEDVSSPLIGEGEADILLAFEKVEAARWSSFLRDGAFAVVNDLAIPPLSVSLGGESYPDDDEIMHILKHRAEVMLVEGSRRAEEMGNPKALNIFMLGALSMLIPFNPDKWEKVIAQRLPPKVVDVNMAAFKQGRRDMLEVFSTIPEEGGDDDGCGCH